MKRDERSERRPTGLAGVLVLCVTVLAVWAGPAEAEVTTLQNGVSPTAEYKGCVDTCLEGYGKTRPRNKDTIFWTPGSRYGLLKFDLAGIAKGRTVHRAVLRLFLAEIPRAGTPVPVYTMARDWDETATWIEWKNLDGTKSPQNNWTKPGGDLDRTIDYGFKDARGKPQPGLIARSAVKSGPMGHYIEFDVTKLVTEWVAGVRPNRGFFISKERYSGAKFCTSEWPMVAFRPTVVVEHYAANERPDPKARLALPDAPGPQAELSPLASTKTNPLYGSSLQTVRFGRNANCQYRKGHTAGYAKTHPRYPGNWGWTLWMRVGGTAGDFNTAHFRFDLSAIPKNSFVAEAKFKVFAEVGNQRVPDQKAALGQVPKETAKERQRRLRGSMSAARELAKYCFGLYPGADTREPGRVGWKWKESAPVAIADLGKQWANELKKKDAFPETWIEWDVTGLVRAWAQGKTPNHGLLLDHRLMGGHMVVYSDDWIDADRRPYLEVRLGTIGKLPKDDGPFKPEPLTLSGDYWVEPMKKVHARWKGTKGTFTQYGDSITVTMAFWTPLLYGTYTGGPKEMQDALATAKKYVHKPCWRNWKDGRYGCAGSTTISWAFSNIDAWQKRMKPEMSVVLWGTNDAAYGPHGPYHLEKYAVVINRMLKDGTVPIITTLPPFSRQRGGIRMFLTVHNLRLAHLAVARAHKLPLIDLYKEMVTRRPDDWDGRLKKFDEGGWKGYNVPTMIARDGIHPSFPKKWQRDWSEEGLNSCGLGLRNYLTLKLWHEIYQKVLKEPK